MDYQSIQSHKWKRPLEDQSEDLQRAVKRSRDGFLNAFTCTRLCQLHQAQCRKPERKGVSLVAVFKRNFAISQRPLDGVVTPWYAPVGYSISLCNYAV